MNSLQKQEIQEVATFIDDVPEEEFESVKQMFKITNLDALNWSFKKLSAYEAKEKEIKTLAEKEKFRIEQWERQELAAITQNKDFFHNLIAEYHAAVLAENPKAKTLSTPYGKTKARVSKEQPKKVDEHLILDHVISANLDEYIKQEVKWGDFKKSLRIVEIGQTKVAVNENGEIVPGVEIEPESIKYSLEVL